MTGLHEDGTQNCRASADGSNHLNEDADQLEASPLATTSVTRVPLHGPVDAHDVMCAKVIFALCGSVFPHPLLLAQQLLGIEDQDFPEFQLNVAEAGNNCIDIVAAYLTNLRVMQLEEEPNPPVSLAMIQPRHAATVASVATKARDLMCELALARATVKPRKAPKNKAIESAVRAAAAAAASSGLTSGASTASSAGASAASMLTSSTEGDTSNSSEEAAFSDLPSDACPAFAEDLCGSESNDDASSCGGPGHQDTSRDGDTPRTAREEEERLLYALQGPAAAEETLKIARARPAGCKGDARSSSSAEPSRNGSAGNPPSSQAQPSTTPTAAASNGGAASGSPRSGPPPPPPARTGSSSMQHPASHNGNGCGPRSNQEGGRGGGGGRTSNTGSQPATNLQSALSCPVTGLPESAVPVMASTGPLGPGAHAQSQQLPGSGHRRGGGALSSQQQQSNGGGGPGAGRRGNAGAGGARTSPTPVSAALQQHHQQHLQQQQQQQLAVAQLLGLRNAYGNNQYQNLLSLQGGFGGGAAGGLSAFAPAGGAAARLDLTNLNSLAATTAALELAAAQQAVAFNAAATNGMAHFGYGGAAAGFGGSASGAGALPGLGSLAGQFGGATNGLGGLGGSPLMHNQQQAAAAAAMLLQQGGGGMMLPDPLKGAQLGGGAADAWSNVLLQAQLAGSLA